MENTLANYMGFYCFLLVDVENHVVFSVAGGTEVHSLQDSKGKAVLSAPLPCVMSLSSSSHHFSGRISIPRTKGSAPSLGDLASVPTSSHQQNEHLCLSA